MKEMGTWEIPYRHRDCTILLGVHHNQLSTTTTARISRLQKNQLLSRTETDLCVQSKYAPWCVQCNPLIIGFKTVKVSCASLMHNDDGVWNNTSIAMVSKKFWLWS